MRQNLLIVFLSWLIIGITYAAGPDVRPVSSSEATAWIRYTVPLPKKIKIVSKISVPENRVAIKVTAPSEPLLEQAVKELQECLIYNTNVSSPPSPLFTIVLQLGGSESAILENLKNAKQAYQITPMEHNVGLRLNALSPQGLYYASKTMQQLIKTKMSNEKIEVPIIEVTDWPDMEDRGLWGSDAYFHLRWLSDRKINLMEQIAGSRVDEHKRTTVALRGNKKLMIDHGPTYGIKPVPAILHLELQHGRGLFNVYPELRGQGGEEGAICYAQPVFIDVLADWIVGYAEMPGVTEVDVWMSENLHGKGGCQCSECKTKNRDLQEIKTIIAAWNKAKKRAPGISLRILTSEETADSNELVFRELPPDVKVWYYHSLLTYNTGKFEMVTPCLADLANQGRSAGVCLNLSATVFFAFPFTGAHFMHYRMNEFVDKKMSGILGYATPGVRYTSFNVEAAAEWSWNAKGRSPREFALSWAVREGLENPEIFAEWSETLGPVAWDVYGSDWPGGEKRTSQEKVAKKLKQGNVPELGFVLWKAFRSPWGDIKSPEQLDKDVDRAQRGVELARKMEIQQFIQESLVVQGLMNSLKALWELKQIVTPEGVAQENRETARRYFQMYVDSLNQSKASLPKWEATVLKKLEKRYRVDKPIKLIEGMIDEMGKLAAELGFDLGKL